MAYVPQPDGSMAWVDDQTGAPAFSVPPQASGPAALLAMQADVDAGVKREPGCYGSIAAGRPPSMATSPEALAQAGPAESTGAIGSGGANPYEGRDKAMAVLDAPSNYGAGGASGVGPAPPPPDPIASVAPPQASMMPEPLVTPGLPGPTGKATGGVVMAGAGGASGGAGATGSGGGFDPYAEWKAQFGRGGGGGGKGGMVPTSMTVQKEGTQSLGTLDEQIRAGANVTKAQQEEALTRSAGAKAASSIYDEQAREDREVATALQASGQNLADKTRVGLEDIQRRTAALANAEVEPGRAWKSLGVGGQLAKMLAVIGGQIGVRMMGSDKNMALELIQQQINDDVEAQRFNIEHQRKGLGDEEKLLQLNRQRFESDAAALDAQRAYGLKAAAAKLESIKQQTQSELERNSISTMQAQLQQRAADLLASVEAKQAGTVSQSFKYAQPGGGGQKLSFGEMLAYGKYMQERGGKQAPLNTVTGPDGTVYTVSAGEGESAKLRETQGIINSTFDQIRGLRPGAADAIINPKLASTYARIVGAGVNKAIGEGSMTKDNEEAYARDLTGMRADEAQKFTENFLRNMSERRIQQVATGVLDPRTGTVTPLAGRERMAPR